ncbi:hypothetical protein SSPO_096620 [Streptomyces antimycoticus]|uniref:Transposase IS110-like N-terminal domain-containing protein n=1 Tax=Streptomyces antimycoticus TaxID=68175 RepID=A0A499UY79_9ACTN|nr:hypothetical protein SSPO_096620 [Streptomyces antimycoticus]
MKVINGEAQIVTLIEAARERADEVRWAVDISGRSSTPLLTLLVAHGQNVVYVPGRTVNRMSGVYRGEARTDAKDALVIADTARVRRGFTRPSPCRTTRRPPRLARGPGPRTPRLRPPDRQLPPAQALQPAPAARPPAFDGLDGHHAYGQAPYQMPLHPPCSGGKRWP